MIILFHISVFLFHYSAFFMKISSTYIYLIWLFYFFILKSNSIGAYLYKQKKLFFLLFSSFLNFIFYIFHFHLLCPARYFFYFLFFVFVDIFCYCHVHVRLVRTLWYKGQHVSWIFINLDYIIIYLIVHRIFLPDYDWLLVQCNIRKYSFP